MDPISTLQLGAAGGMARVVDALPVGYAFGAGMMSAVNPCGFALLPTYLALFLGAGRDSFRSQPASHRFGRALGVSGAVSAGFILLFGLVGGVVVAGARAIVAVMPWVSLVLGVGLVGVGAWMLAGRHLGGGPLLRWGAAIGSKPGNGLRGYFLYGLAFGMCSVSCTLPVFLVVVGSALAAGGPAAGLAYFLSYGLGMGAVVTALTLAVALFKEGALLAGARRAMPYLQNATAVFVMAGGLYVVYYWVFKGDLIG